MIFSDTASAYGLFQVVFSDLVDHLAVATFRLREGYALYDWRTRLWPESRILLQDHLHTAKPNLDLETSSVRFESCLGVC
jgi:hypothetical protein